jgi:hypothetical protein
MTIRDAMPHQSRAGPSPEKAMKLYAVRMIETCQPVGLFWAKDVSDLVVAIDFDDVISPTRCEYLTIETTGALVWYDHESWQLGEPPGEADDLAAFEQRVEQVLENISFDGSLFALIYRGRRKAVGNLSAQRRRPMRSWHPRLPRPTLQADNNVGQAVWQAPIGHRQPRAKDVPPRVEENLGIRSPERGNRQEAAHLSRLLTYDRRSAI